MAALRSFSSYLPLYIVKLSGAAEKSYLLPTYLALRAASGRAKYVPATYLPRRAARPPAARNTYSLPTYLSASGRAKHLTYLVPTHLLPTCSAYPPAGYMPSPSRLVPKQVLRYWAAPSHCNSGDVCDRLERLDLIRQRRSAGWSAGPSRNRSAPLLMRRSALPRQRAARSSWIRNAATEAPPSS